MDRRDLLRLLGLHRQGGQGLTEQDLRDLLKVEAPLAVQSNAPRPGFFPFNKFSAVPLLIKAARAANAESDGDDVKKRLMIVPDCHVTRLATEGGGVTVRVVWTNQGPVPVPPGGVVVLAAGTIESARLALGIRSLAGSGRLTFPMRDQIGAQPDGASALQPDHPGAPPRSSPIRLPQRAGGLGAVRQGTARLRRRPLGHFHLQITAAGLDKPSGDSEAELFKKIPDIDTFDAS